MRVFVLLFRDESGNEGIHTLSIGDQNIVLMFEEEDDATRYALLLEAQDFMAPTVEEIDRQEIEDFCEGANYQSKLVPKGFIPENDADRLMIVPPSSNLDQTEWEQDVEREDDAESSADEGSAATSDARSALERSVQAEPEPEPPSTSDLDDIRRRLEGLL